MSLFKLKTIWNASFPQQQFDEKHIVYGLIDKIPTIVFGSFKGNLRVYSLEANRKSNLNVFKQILDKSFNQPIIDVKFVTHPNQSIRNNTIGVLMFRKFLYISLQANKDSPLYTAKILNIQVQPSFAIIPYPISLATLNSSIQTLNPKQIHPIKQSDPIYPFTMSRQDLYYMDGQDLVKTIGTVEQWRIIIGRVRSLFLIDDILIVVGELNLWQVDEGKIIKCKKLQEEVSCAAIAHRVSHWFNIIVCNFLMQMLVYSSDYKLLWAVKLDYVPIKIIVSEFELLKGAMILLTDQSSVQVTYIGAQVQQRVLKPMQENVNLERVQKQTQYFIQKAKQLKSNPNAKLKQVMKTDQNSANSDLNIKLSFSQPQQTSQFMDNSQQLYKSSKNQKLIKCILSIQLLAQNTQLQKVLITFIKPTNIFVKGQQVELEKLRGKQFVKIDCFISKEKFPYQTKIMIRVRYQKGKSTKIIEKEIQIPMNFQCQIDSFESVENIDKKITFKCSQNALPIFNQLFPDVMQRGCGQQKKAITFILANGVKSSIVYNKNLTKVKIQSEVYSGLCFIFMQFIKRIQNYHNKNKLKMPPVQIQISLKQLEQQIRDYHSYRDQLKNQYKDLIQKTQQFKKTQKKMLLKMKQKNCSIEHINKLLEFSYTRVLQSTYKYQQLQQQRQIVNHNFQIGLKFVMQLVYRRSAASQQARQKAQSIIKFDSQNQDILDEQGWAQRLTKNTAFYLNKKYDTTVQNLEKLVTWVITKVNNGDWNS